MANKTNPLIFLDIDGVMNSQYGEGEILSNMEIRKLERLSSLIKKSQSLGIIITSDRRYSDIDLKNKTEAFVKYDIPVLGSLRYPNIDDDEDNRGKQILNYLSSLDYEVEKILILDDNDEGISTYFPEDFLHLNRFYGFDEDSYDLALKMLG